MNDSNITKPNNLIKDTQAKDYPHVVILGAGASLAAFPNGDKNGKKLPLMNNLIDVVGLKGILENHGTNIVDQNNFEDVYSDLCDNKNENAELLTELEKKVYNYFSSLTIPYAPTLYDHLVLSLRKNDVIATFNWDPFLFQACDRVYKFITKNVPKLFFLHGNVAIKIDLEKGAKVDVHAVGENYKRSKLLYPTKKKDYSSDPFISAEWNAVIRYLKEAFMLTIFGYGAPKTDKEAISLLQSGWGTSTERNLKQVELIDLKQKDKLLDTWKSFTHSHPYQVYTNFYDSITAKYPRKSCKTMERRCFEREYLDEGTKKEEDCNPWKMDNHISLRNWVAPYVEEE